jgi:hypothetical protein
MNLDNLKGCDGGNSIIFNKYINGYTNSNGQNINGIGAISQQDCEYTCGEGEQPGCYYSKCKKTDSSPGKEQPMTNNDFKYKTYIICIIIVIILLLIIF